MTSAETAGSTNHYHEELRSGIERIYAIARKARAMNLDPHGDVEALPAGDLAARVEGLVGPPGIGERIRSVGRDNVDKIIDSLLTDVTPHTPVDRKEAAVEQALRTSLAIQTEGVVAAPIEGISAVKIKRNPDGSEYLSIYFAGPIRSAGGTAQGFTILAADYIRRKVGLTGYRPTRDEVERYVEEIKLYDERISNLQYTPTEDEIRGILANLQVCVDGDPTEEMEVAIHRDLPRIDSNRIRGGMCLVIAEGLAQKRSKIMKYASKFGLDWGWMAGITRDKESEEEKPKAKFMDEVVGGRPIFSAPSAKGGFRLRYGHSRCNGIAAKGIHPATMILTDEFIATGTQVKVEKPGKGCVVTECDTVEGPIVRLKNGDVLRVDTREKAYEVRDEVEEILFLGDILVSYGDFLQTNTRLVPSGYVEEWWTQEAEGANPKPTPDEAVELSLTEGIPLHPKYTHFWADVSAAEVGELVDWLMTGKIDGALTIPNNSPDAKRTLEYLGIQHQVRDGAVQIGEYKPLLAQLGIEWPKRERFDTAYSKINPYANAYELILQATLVPLRNKCGAYIGCRMGRPEKSKERKMQPAVHALFPIGDAGGRERSINAAVDRMRVEVEVSQFICPKCRIRTFTPSCPACGERALNYMSCGKCGYAGNSPTCPRCKVATRQYAKTNIDLKELWDKAVERVGKSANVKGVIGMISASKVPEPLEKGLLRAIHEVYVFKDGTIRFDATDVPLTHFRPREIGTPVERLRQLGYDRDCRGAPLVDEEQVLELKTQDIVVSEYCGSYMVRVANFTDNLLRKFYGMSPVYNVAARDDLVGHLIVGLAPHTSAGIIGRVIGYTRANVCFAHPFWHAAKRRNADGDEDSIMLLLDMLLNFSKVYLPQTRGGKMDAPLVVTTIMNPKEIDDEAHKMEIVESYPVEFYKKTLEGANPSEVEIRTVSSILDTNPYGGIKYTHDTGDITGPVTKSRYVTLKTMPEKIEAQLAVAKKIRAIDEREVAEIVLNSHFLRDTYGNLRAFTRQHFRCVKCNENYRRIPLSGKCNECGGKLLLTVSEGNISKYLKMSMDLAEKYHLSNYLKSRLRLLEKDLESLMKNDLKKQVSLADYM